jgi:hypothetical protein
VVLLKPRATQQQPLLGMCCSVCLPVEKVISDRHRIINSIEKNVLMKALPWWQVWR